MEARGCGEACYAAGDDGVGDGDGWKYGASACQRLSDLDMLSFGFARLCGDNSDHKGGSRQIQ